MDVFATEWLNLLLRWAHIATGIAWIGTSFYFVALDLALARRGSGEPGVLGEAWEVHGGGFYEVRKYTVAPAHLPDDLIWYKWEAYLTWITGFALLVVQYYIGASSYLIDSTVLPLSPGMAILISVLSLLTGWLVYDAMVRRIEDPAILAAGLFGMLVLFAWVFSLVYSGRGAFIHIGSLIGTIMAVNVFGVIIPNQRKITASLLAGEAPDPALGKAGKTRSLHNNYLTLPLLVFMISNHYPMLHSHPQGWLIAALVILLGGSVRHALNRHDAGLSPLGARWVAPAAVGALAALLLMTAPRLPGAAVAAAVTDAEAAGIAQAHCAACHAAVPSHEFFDEAPGGVRLETAEDLRRHAAGVLAQSVYSQAMPLGNETGMTEAERAALGAWLAQ